MSQDLYIIEAEGPFCHPGLWVLDVVQTQAEAKAWMHWFARIYKAEGWFNFQFYPVDASSFQDMLQRENQ